MTFTTSKYQELFSQTWPISSPKAVIVIAHGLGEHSGRYKHVAEFLNQHGYSVVALDHQGHGQSVGQKGHIESFENYIADLFDFIELTKKDNQDKEIYLLGHSMGGLIATGYVLRYSNVDKVIISAPPYGVPGKSAQMQLKIGAFLGKFLPKTSTSNNLDASTVCSTKSVVDAYIADELVHDKITLGWGKAFLDEQNYIRKHIAEIELPLLMLLPQADVITDPIVTDYYFKQMPQNNKSIKYYPDSFHEVLNEEVDGPKALQDIVDWLAK